MSVGADDPLKLPIKRAPATVERLPSLAPLLAHPDDVSAFVAVSHLSRRNHMRRVFLIVVLAGAMASSPAWAQSSSAQAQTSAQTQTTAQTQTEERAARMATATYWGDTGLWFVPTAEVVRPRGWSLSAYRTEFDFRQGLTDVSDFPITGAFGAGSRVEVFGALRVVTRIDRDTRPLFEPTTSDDAGLTNERPFVRDTWTGNQLGDLYLGGKANLLSEGVRQPLALAVRGTVKLPTADEDEGAGTGQYDYFADVVMSKEVVRRVEVTGFTGWAWRGDPDGVSLSDGWRWGVGAAFGARANLRLTTEFFGEVSSDDDVIAQPGVVTGTDGSVSPVLSDLHQGTTSVLGLTWQHSSGVSLGAAGSYQSGLDLPSGEGSRGWGMQFRIGFHRGVRIYVPPAPPRFVGGLAPPPEPAPVPAPAPPPPPPPPANRLPTLTAQCDPCRVQVGRTSTLRAISEDLDGDNLAYRWSPAGGTIADTRAITTTWTAETKPGTYPVTVTVDDGKGGVASATVNIEVFRAAIVFDEVRFDLDRAELRPEARTVLNQAAATLKENPDVRLQIEGHTSSEASEQYNLALGDRRAQAVRDYLVSQGVDSSRLETVSYGKTRPKYDNSNEATRPLNRRAALVVEGGN
jgi:peptidoglycan-associated lipoprotein